MSEDDLPAGSILEMRVRVWTNPKVGRTFATPEAGPWADELFGVGDTDEEAIQSLRDAMVREERHDETR